MAVDIIARGMAGSAGATASLAISKIEQFANGINFKGSVNYVSDLPTGASYGDAYTVKYEGSSGTVAYNHLYAWGKENGTDKWIDISISYANKYVTITSSESSGTLTQSELAILLEKNENGILFVNNSVINNFIYSWSKSDGTERNYLGFKKSGDILTTYVINVNMSSGAWTLTSQSSGSVYSAGEGISISSENVISATLRYDKYYPINVSVTHGTYTITEKLITSEETSTIVITPNQYYGLPTTVSVSGASYTYNSTTGQIVISDAEDVTEITVTAVMVYTRQLNAPVLTYSDKVLHIEDTDGNTQSFDIYDNDTFVANVVKED